MALHACAGGAEWLLAYDSQALPSGSCDDDNTHSATHARGCLEESMTRVM